MPLPNSELRKATTPGLDDIAARFERDAVPLLDQLYRAARRYTRTHADYDAPIQGFSRYVARDVDMDGVLLPAGSRAIVFYGAANRDERKYPDPDRFDVLRRPGDHMGFGAGPHACVGMNLARIEMLALFTELAKRVRRFTIEEEKPLLNNVLRGFKTLRITVS